ncbi:urea ABC transporter permease subunit UrtB [Sulfitobacter sp. KE34]|uniref:Urea ABC transporter permease subunit UrtB n=1 Tax=Sulfitobacter faviae TaxID=1775881 RepID=A0AAX3LPS3_9RHOB|nr:MULTISPECIES: urea ABC transporter permease subunit UrtB [Sulfitobacter]MDF3351791.1 urea ABC transporter permease subunit UrtB [Sulfitobacter sp. KE12]MDF3355463.1 urea ABC transporter permease subunit UrtB [Sulfitobacter sp. KE27]MDF3359111.1 urea ABC transporter permease subunit UrtB [Sulfitobacter sp. KE33]MDF3361488.1 urea ABC transporter permease subunit UrtB [Sulfitobacter sp. Ks41]MDF3366535.1 urea ABC transporter permease subunit UrtB [Sulfitobacter sp. Ks34]
MVRMLLSLMCLLASVGFASAQDLQSLLQTHEAEVIKPSRKSVGVLLDDLVASGLPQVPAFLEQWAERNVWQDDTSGLFYFGAEADDTLALRDIDTGEEATAPSDGFSQLRPNGGVRRVIGTALVQFQLSDPDPARRRAALESIARRSDASQLGPLVASLDGEDDPALRARKAQLANFLTARFGQAADERIRAIESLSSDTSLEARAVLSQILSAKTGVAEQQPEGNIARILDPMAAPLASYETLVEAGLAPGIVPHGEIRAALEAKIVDGRVGGVPLAQLDDPARRVDAYRALAEVGSVPPLVTQDDIDTALQNAVFYERYAEEDAAITDAARATLDAVETRVGWAQTLDLTLDGLSLASIYFLAAIGLAITFGQMGVINMAHGEFIMMGAYTGYVVQLVIPDYTMSLLIALPLAFAVTFGAGVAMERLVIRHLYHRPLETLLATFGISIALQQIAKNIFGTQARPLTSPEWLRGALVISDVVQISFIRIAIFVLALIFLFLLLYILKRTRLGLEVRAVTQNPGMAASMGINPDRINMMTFGLGSGIAGVAGVGIGLYAQVTSEMGTNYIVQSFMTVVVGGVGSVFGTLAGAGLIGFLQKGIEWLNPSNTLAAQTYMILFIILFIQFRPKGIVAPKGRAAAD